MEAAQTTDAGRMAHTPGPWSAEGPDQFGDYNIHCQHERAVVAAVISNLRSSTEVAVNARLIAAAPDLVKALEGAVAHIEHMAAWITAQKAGYSFESLGEDMPEIRAALAAAKGSQP